MLGFEIWIDLTIKGDKRILSRGNSLSIVMGIHEWAYNIQIRYNG